MNHDTSCHSLPSLVAHVTNNGTHYIDNLFANAWISLNINRRQIDRAHGAPFT